MGECAWFFFRIVFGVALGYLIVSIGESYLHRHIAHGGTDRLRKRKRLLGLRKLTSRAFYSHHVVHHCLTFRQDHVTQFQNQAERDRVNATLVEKWSGAIQAERYGLTLRGFGIIRFVAPVLPVFSAVWWMCGTIVFAGSLLPLILYPLMSMVLHRWLHVPHREVERNAHPLVRWLFATRYMKAVVGNHYMHHKYLHCNYNLLLGGDFLLGVYRRPSKQDLADMNRIGLQIE